MTPKDRLELTKNILIKIAEAGFILSVFVLPGMAGILKQLGVSNWNESGRYRRAIKNLQKQGSLKYYEKNGKEYFEITKKGKKTLLAYEFESLSIKRPSKWDGLFRVVAFDIPERKKKAREKFRFKLLELGFQKLQNSVFIFPYECFKEIKFMKNHLYLDSEVTYMLAKEVEGKVNLKNKFKL